MSKISKRTIDAAIHFEYMLVARVRIHDLRCSYANGGLPVCEADIPPHAATIHVGRRT